MVASPWRYGVRAESRIISSALTPSSVDAQWVTARKDWREAKRRYKMHQKSKTSSAAPVDPAADSAPYEEHMDEMRCILYSHGGAYPSCTSPHDLDVRQGGYYFGSVDQERYSIQRHARKINGRVFAINYRLAPQYPFPCALQDLIAACASLHSPNNNRSDLTYVRLVSDPATA
jgi:acetyl esterase/lipase